jgi:Calpain family cysteine protease
MSAALVSSVMCRNIPTSLTPLLHRNPKSWALFGLKQGAAEYELLHETKDEMFTEVYQVKAFELPECADGVLFASLQLRILEIVKKGAGIQLSQLAVFQDPNRINNSPAVAATPVEDSGSGVGFDWTFGLGWTKSADAGDNAAATEGSLNIVVDVSMDEQVEDTEGADKKSFKSIRSVGSAFGSIKKKFAKFFAKGSTEPFTDPDFPPTSDSLFKIDPLAEQKGESTIPTDDGELPEIEWKRPKDFVEGDVKVFDGAIKFSDVAQGQLGDCWLMCSIAAIAEFEPLVRDLVVMKDCNPDTGTYVVRLCKDGAWKRLVVDDWFPCSPGEGPIYSQCCGDEIWAMLLEKAFAKCNGSYAAIRSGFPHEAMIDLTGSPFKEFTLSDPVVEGMIGDGSLWSCLVSYDSLNYIMTLTTAGVDHATEGGGDREGGGLVPGHAYTLIGVKESGDLKLCKIRNPWGQFEWDGDWSDKSCLWTANTKKIFGWTDEDDGIFWMSFEDVCKNFIGINVCLVRHAGLDTVVWNEDRKKFKYKFRAKGGGVESVQMYKLKVKEDGAEVYVTVHQPDKRRIGTPDYFDIGVAVLRFVKEGEYELVSFKACEVKRQQQLDVSPGVLSAGSYLIVPMSTGCRVQAEVQALKSSGGLAADADALRQRNCVLSVHCE